MVESSSIGAPEWGSGSRRAPSPGPRDGDGGWRVPCFICRQEGAEVAPHRLTHGICVFLCRAHRDARYLTRAGGTVFCDRLARAWAASGALTSGRVKALQAHLRAVGPPGPERPRPGSYSWPRLRREAESRFAAGESPGRVIEELRRRHRDDPADVPSVRTMRRWFFQKRWLLTGSSARSTVAPAAHAARRARARALSDMLPRLAGAAARALAWCMWPALESFDPRSRGEPRRR